MRVNYALIHSAREECRRRSCARRRCSPVVRSAALEIVPLGEIEQPPSGERIRLLGQIARPLREAAVEIFHDATPATSLKARFQCEMRCPSSGLTLEDKFRDPLVLAAQRELSYSRQEKSDDTALLEPEAVPDVREADDGCARRCRRGATALRLSRLRGRSISRPRGPEVGRQPAAAAGQVAPHKSAPAAVLLPGPIALSKLVQCFAVQPAVPDFVPSNLPRPSLPEPTSHLRSQVEGAESGVPRSPGLRNRHSTGTLMPLGTLSTLRLMARFFLRQLNFAWLGRPFPEGIPLPAEVIDLCSHPARCSIQISRSWARICPRMRAISLRTQLSFIGR